MREAAILFIIFSVMVAGALLARRNLRMGSGDRRGAFRVALFCGAATMLAWLFLAHHVPSPGAEAQIFFQGVADALFEGAMVWITYVAIEPIVRRRWPDLLFSWSRVLAGRFRDPLVGRDALAGILGGDGERSRPERLEQPRELGESAGHDTRPALDQVPPRRAGSPRALFRDASRTASCRASRS